MSYYTFEFLDYINSLVSDLSLIDSTCLLTKVVAHIKPIKVYKTLQKDRLNLFKEQKEKTGVYCLVNLINGNTYSGSSVNMEHIMKSYLNNSFLKSNKNSNMPITLALSKYMQEHFAVLIVECVNIENLTKVETYYIASLLPYYNVLKQGKSSLGYKHTEDNKNFLSDLAKNRIHSDKNKALISRAVIGENNPSYNKNHSADTKLIMIKANSAYPVYIYNSIRILLVISRPLLL
jgi:group I intron endonuclease